MKIGVISFSDIKNHPTGRLDAKYHIGKKEGMRAYKKKDKGELVEDDINGKIILTDSQAKEYNEVKEESNKIAEKLANLKDKFNLED